MHAILPYGEHRDGAPTRIYLIRLVNHSGNVSRAARWRDQPRVPLGHARPGRALAGHPDLRGGRLGARPLHLVYRLSGSPRRVDAPGRAQAAERLTLATSLRRAIDREEFELHYQPIVEARTGVTVGAEALVRWRHPELGLLLPSEFITLAEENGMIVPLGEWVLYRACLDNRSWQSMGLPPIRVTVNLSSRQIKRSLTEAVQRVLQQSSLDARYLGLELTESVLVNHHKDGTDTLHALRAMGLHLSVDDFGTGYSSFSYLKRFPLDALKIDRCFVREIANDPEDAAITTAMIAMGHALGLKVVAEGVETDAQSLLLRRQGCDEMHGYLFGRPLPAASLAQFLAGSRPTARTIARRVRASESKAS